MVNSPLIRPYFLRGVALGGIPYIPMMKIDGHVNIQEGIAGIGVPHQPPNVGVKWGYPNLQPRIHFNKKVVKRTEKS